MDKNKETETIVHKKSFSQSLAETFNVIRIIALLALIILIVVCAFNIDRDNEHRPSIISIDGIAYVSFNDNISMLLDSNGNKIPYNDTVLKEHELIVYGNAYVDNPMLIILDTNTNRSYVMLSNYAGDTPMVSVMYNQNLIDTME